MYMQFSLYDAYCTIMFPETIAVFQSSSFSKVVNVGHYQHFHCFHHNYYILMTPITCTTTIIVVVVHVIGITYHFTCYNHDHNHCQGHYHHFLQGKSEITGHIPLSLVRVPVTMLKILKVKNKAPRLASGTSPIWKGHAWTFLSQDKSLLSQDETFVSQGRTPICWEATLPSQGETLVSQEGGNIFLKDTAN